MIEVTTQPTVLAEKEKERASVTPTQRHLSRRLRLALFLIGMVLAGVQCWSMRHEILSDGISYLEIASQYAHGDWWNALNAYWSPLFSLTVAAVLFVLRPAPYWQVGAMHLTIFLEYLLCLAAFDLLMKELLFYRDEKVRAEKAGSEAAPNLSSDSIYLSAFAALLFVSWSYINFWYCSPDMLAMGLLLLLSTVIMRIRRTGGTVAQFAALGVIGGLSFLARTAFLPTFIICLAMVGAMLWKKRPMARALAIVTAGFLLIALPFVFALSTKEKRWTIGDSGKLNYSWELDGAHRWVHWQGEPGNIGTPLHPTHLALSSPKTFTFAEPIESSYPPWYAPAYWYAGVNPRIDIRHQLHALLINFSILARLLLRSPILLPLFVFIVLSRDRRTLRNLAGLWPVLLPSIATICLYALVYMEKRYVAGNIWLLWVAPLVCLRLRTERLLRAAQFVLPATAILVAGAYAATRFRGAIADSVIELIHGQEKFQNVNYVIADNLHRLGLCPGDKVAVVGPGMNFDWARIADVKIVAEVPLMYERVQTLLNNLHVDDPKQIKQFFQGDPETRRQVLDIFSRAGAKMVVTDGFYSYKMSDKWPKIIETGRPHMRKFDPRDWSLLNSRYLRLTPYTGSCPAK